MVALLDLLMLLLLLVVLILMLWHDSGFVVDHVGGMPARLLHILVVLGLFLPLIQLVVNIFLPLLRRPVAVVTGPVTMATGTTLNRGLCHFLRAQVRVMPLHVTGEAGHVHIVELAHGVRITDLVQALLTDLGLLAVGRLVALLSAPVTDNLDAGRAPLQILGWLVEVGDFALINPVLLVAEVRHDCQLQVMRRDHILNMDEAAVGTQVAEAKHVVGTHSGPIYDIAVALVKRVVEIAHFTTEFAEPALKKRTHLLFLVPRSSSNITWSDDQRVELLRLWMLVQAVLAFLALPVLLIKAANGHASLIKMMHELALVAFLAAVAHPMHTDRLLTLLLIDCLVDRPQVRVHVVDGHEPVRLLHSHMPAAL